MEVVGKNLESIEKNKNMTDSGNLIIRASVLITMFSFCRNTDNFEGPKKDRFLCWLPVFYKFYCKYRGRLRQVKEYNNLHRKFYLLGVVS